MKRPNNWKRGPGGTAKTGKPEGPYLNYEEVAQKLGGINVATLKLRIKEAGIKPVRPGRTPFLHENDVPKLIEATRERPEVPLPKPRPLPGSRPRGRPRSVNTAANRRHGRTPALSGT